MVLVGNVLLQENIIFLEKQSKTGLENLKKGLIFQKMAEDAREDQKLRI